jgi:hypothetical protein
MALDFILFEVILDPTVVGPRHSNPTSEICSILLHDPPI